MRETILSYPADFECNLFDTATGTAYTLSWEKPGRVLLAVGHISNLGGPGVPYTDWQALSTWGRLASLQEEKAIEKAMVDVYEQVEKLMTKEPPEADLILKQEDEWMQLSKMRVGTIFALADTEVAYIKTNRPADPFDNYNEKTPRLYINLHNGMPLGKEAEDTKMVGRVLTLVLEVEDDRP